LPNPLMAFGPIDSVISDLIKPRFFVFFSLCLRASVVKSFLEKRLEYVDMKKQEDKTLRKAMFRGRKSARGLSITHSFWDITHFLCLGVSRQTLPDNPCRDHRIGIPNLWRIIHLTTQCCIAL